MQTLLATINRKLHTGTIEDKKSNSNNAAVVVMHSPSF